MWTLSMFFLEIRMFFSGSLLLYMWYKMGLLDMYLHYLLIKELRRIAKLPVEVDSVQCFVNGTAFVQGIRLKAPPLEEDSRWEWDDIASVELVEVHFPFFIGFIFFVLSNGELAIVDTAHVHGVSFNIEGFRDINEELTLNVQLICGGVSSRKRNGSSKRRKSAKKSMSEKIDVPNEAIGSKSEIEDTTLDQYITDFGMKKFICMEDYFMVPTTAFVNDSNESRQASPRTIGYYEFEQFHLDDGDISFVRKYIDAYPPASSTPSTLASYLPYIIHSQLESASDVKNSDRPNDPNIPPQAPLPAPAPPVHTNSTFTHPSHHQSFYSSAVDLYHNTIQKVYNAYERTKQHIDESLQDRLIQLHIDVSGYEPLPIPNDQRFICRELIYDRIEINLLRVLPIQLRNFEKKSLAVPKLIFKQLGYQNLNFLEILDSILLPSSTTSADFPGATSSLFTGANSRRLSSRLSSSNLTKLSGGRVMSSNNLAKMNHNPPERSETPTAGRFSNTANMGKTQSTSTNTSKIPRGVSSGNLKALDNTRPPQAESASSKSMSSRRNTNSNNPFLPPRATVHATPITSEPLIRRHSLHANTANHQTKHSDPQSVYSQYRKRSPPPPTRRSMASSSSAPMNAESLSDGSEQSDSFYLSHEEEDAQFMEPHHHESLLGDEDSEAIDEEFDEDYQETSKKLEENKLKANKEQQQKRGLFKRIREKMKRTPSQQHLFEHEQQQQQYLQERQHTMSPPSSSASSSSVIPPTKRGISVENTAMEEHTGKFSYKGIGVGVTASSRNSSHANLAALTQAYYGDAAPGRTSTHNNLPHQQSTSSTAAASFAPHGHEEDAYWQHHIIDLTSIDVYHGGLQVNIFRYQFERQLLMSLYRYNAGAIAKELLNFRNWKFSTSKSHANPNDEYEDGLEEELLLYEQQMHAATNPNNNNNNNNHNTPQNSMPAGQGYSMSVDSTLDESSTHSSSSTASNNSSFVHDPDNEHRLHLLKNLSRRKSQYYQHLHTTQQQQQQEKQQQYLSQHQTSNTIKSPSPSQHQPSSFSQSSSSSPATTTNPVSATTAVPSTPQSVESNGRRVSYSKDSKHSSGGIKVSVVTPTSTPVGTSNNRIVVEHPIFFDDL